MTVQTSLTTPSEDSMTVPVTASMTVQVSGRHVDVGEALRTRISDELNTGIGKYFGRGGSADVVLSRDGFGFCVEIRAHLASGQELETRGTGVDAHAAFDAALTKLEARIRRYKTRLKSHHPHLGGAAGARAVGPAELASLVVLRGDDDDGMDNAWDESWENESASDAPPAAMIVAETEAQVRTLSVAMAVMELDLSDAPVILFRNAGHGGLSVVYRRKDGNIGWIDPERTRSAGVSPRSALKGGKPNGHDAHA